MNIILSISKSAVFKDAKELTELVKGMQQHIQDCLNASWQEREEIDWTVFV